MKKTVGTFEAKTNFTKLITQVMDGDEVLISRRGKVVARITQLEKAVDLESTNASVLRIRKLAKEMSLGSFNWNEWKNYRDKGRA